MLRSLRKLFNEDPEKAARRAAEKAAREHEQSLRKAQAELAQWEHDCSDLAEEIEACRNYRALSDEGFDTCPIVTKRGEEVLLVCESVPLVETRRAPKASYGGTSHGLSIKIAKGVYYRPSVHRGTIQQAPEETRVIDGEDGAGVFVITNTRAVFRGNLHTREFRWDKLVSVSPEELLGGYALMMPVENRQRVSGIYVGDDSEDADFVMRRIMFGIALSQGREDEFIAKLENELDELRAAQPTLPDAPACHSQ